MRLAILFSGQGGQRPEHATMLRRELPPELAPALAAALPGGWEEGEPTEAQLAENRFAQPFLFALAMARWRRLEKELPRPVCAAGYSLGEMAAACAAGAFAPDAGLALCAERARLMDAAAGGPSGMVAILGLEDAAVERIAASCGLAVAIRNGPRHVVLAGPAAGIPEAEARAAAQGATRTVRLPVTTPSHTPALAPAAAAFARRLEGLPDGPLAFPVLSAIDGSAARGRSQALAALARQICTPLDWAACLATVVEMQPDAVLEIGPGNALTRLLAELAPALPARAWDDFRTPAGILAWVRSLA